MTAVVPPHPAVVPPHPAVVPSRHASSRPQLAEEIVDATGKGLNERALAPVRQATLCKGIRTLERMREQRVSPIPHVGLLSIVFLFQREGHPHF